MRSSLISLRTASSTASCCRFAILCRCASGSAAGSPVSISCAPGFVAGTLASVARSSASASGTCSRRLTLALSPTCSDARTRTRTRTRSRTCSRRLTRASPPTLSDAPTSACSCACGSVWAWAWASACGGVGSGAAGEGAARGASLVKLVSARHSPKMSSAGDAASCAHARRGGRRAGVRLGSHGRALSVRAEDRASARHKTTRELPQLSVDSSAARCSRTGAWRRLSARV
eukprot:6198090-Pleurochrysis_carterae.AAC.1